MFHCCEKIYLTKRVIKFMPKTYYEMDLEYSYFLLTLLKNKLKANDYLIHAHLTSWANAIKLFTSPSIETFEISQSVCPWQVFQIQSNKHSSLLRKLVNYLQKSFITLGPECLSVCLLSCLSASPSICLFFDLSTPPSLCLSVCLFIQRSISPAVTPSGPNWPVLK